MEPMNSLNAGRGGMKLFGANLETRGVSVNCSRLFEGAMIGKIQEGREMVYTCRIISGMGQNYIPGRMTAHLRD